MNEPQQRAYLRHKEAAEYLRVSPALLAKQVRLGTGPPRRRIGRIVLYAVADLKTWMDAKIEDAA